jgi:serine protease Do
MKSAGSLCILTLGLWAAALGAVAGSAAGERLFAMPVFETQEVIRPWLESRGFEIFQTTQDATRVQLEAETPHLHWIITLKAHSALATRVVVEPLRGADHPLLNAFWDYLDGYVKLPSSGEPVKPAVIPAEVRNRLNAIVCIYSEGNGPSFQVSGFALDHGGLILSTAHDLKIGYTVSVRFHNGREVNGRVIKLDTDQDLGLIEVPEKIESVIPISRGRYLPGRGEMLYALSCVQGRMDEIQTGVLDGPPRRVEGAVLWQVRMHVEPGSSGSPVFDDQGRLTGVIKGRYRGTHMVGFVIPFETLLHFLEKY